MTFSGIEIVPDASGVLIIPEAELLIVSDLHLEKGTSYAHRALTLPPYDTRTTLRRLAQVLERLKPQRVVSLGDSFHDRGAEARIEADDAGLLRSLTDRYSWTWVLGNHDPEPPKRFGGVAVSELAVGGVMLRHEPDPETKHREIIGHYHPCAVIRRRGRRVRRKCFGVGEARLIMPAFGAYTGGLNILDEACRPWMGRHFWAFMLGEERVFPVDKSHLVADQPYPAGTLRARSKATEKDTKNATGKATLGAAEDK